MKIRKKSLGIMISTAALVLAMQMPVSAESISELKNQKSEVEGQKKELNSQINKKSSEINSIEAKQKKLLDQITKLTDEISNTNDAIVTVKVEINVAADQIVTLQSNIKALQEKIDQRDELLADRARALQANGSVGFLDVLLGANSFVEFIDRYSAVNTLMDADRQIMKEQKEDQLKLEEEKVVLENTKQELENKKAELDSLKASLDSQKEEKDKLIDQLEAQQEKIASEKQDLEVQYEEVVEISDELNSQIAAEQKRLLEIARKQEAERKARAEAEAAAAAAARAKAESSSNSGNSGSSSRSSGGSAPAVSMGHWTKPANGVFTSPYGARIHPISGQYKFHYGIDIANSTGTPIVSAADGVVTYAGGLSTYGNVVMVTHTIEGQVFTSLYAHLSTINVSVGTQVSKGQQIAAMGNTGASTGPHLHFEIHKGTWVSPSAGSVNPLNYISL